jgi:hypothetical protein
LQRRLRRCGWVGLAFGGLERLPGAEGLAGRQVQPGQLAVEVCGWLEHAGQLRRVAVQGLVQVVVPAAQDVAGQQLGPEQRVSDPACRQRVLVMARVADEGPSGPGRPPEVGGQVADADHPARQLSVVQLGGDARAARQAGAKILLAVAWAPGRDRKLGEGQHLAAMRGKRPREDARPQLRTNLGQRRVVPVAVPGARTSWPQVGVRRGDSPRDRGPAAVRADQQPGPHGRAGHGDDTVVPATEAGGATDAGTSPSGVLL